MVFQRFGSTRNTEKLAKILFTYNLPLVASQKSAIFAFCVAHFCTFICALNVSIFCTMTEPTSGTTANAAPPQPSSQQASQPSSQPSPQSSPQPSSRESRDRNHKHGDRKGDHRRNDHRKPDERKPDERKSDDRKSDDRKRHHDRRNDHRKQNNNKHGGNEEHQSSTASTASTDAPSVAHADSTASTTITTTNGATENGASENGTTENGTTDRSAKRPRDERRDDKPRGEKRSRDERPERQERPERPERRRNKPDDGPRAVSQDDPTAPVFLPGRQQRDPLAGYVRRTMYSEFGATGNDSGNPDDDASTERPSTKEELVFPPAVTIGAPGMNVNQSTLFTGARGAAIRVLSRVDRSDTYLDRALEQELAESNLSALDRALLTELVHGVLRWQSKLDWVLTGFYHGEFVKCITPVKNAMRIALYQIMFLTKIPPFAAVNESVELIKRLKGVRSANLVNAVLRNILHNMNNIRYPFRESGDPARYLSIMYGHPAWLVRRWLERFGEEQTELLLKTNNERPKISLRLSPLQGTRTELQAFLDTQQIKHWDFPHDERLLLVGSLSSVHDWEAYQQGWFSIQDPSAAMVVRLAAPKRGQTVVDLCAAPGGKATFAAELMENEGNVLAVDKYEGKLAIVRQNASRLRLDCITTHAADATTLRTFDLFGDLSGDDSNGAREADAQGEVGKNDRQGASTGEATTQSNNNPQSKNKHGNRPQNKQQRGGQQNPAKTIEARNDNRNDSRGDNRDDNRDDSRGEARERKAAAMPPQADIVLVDAPCSGTGTLAKKPDIRWKLTVENIAPLVKLQRQILRNAAALVKPGGVLVYSTCSIETEENTGNAAWFLATFPEFTLDAAENHLPAELCRDGYLQTFPHNTKTDGAFAARFVRSSSAPPKAVAHSSPELPVAEISPEVSSEVSPETASDVAPEAAPELAPTSA
jgi:16S rRNA (cytosine(967)-C(5))-methyltransferase